MAEKRIPTAVYCRASTQEDLAYQVGLAFSYIAHCDLEYVGLHVDTGDHTEWDKLKQMDTAKMILLPSIDVVNESKTELDSIAKSLGIVIETVDGSYTSDPAELKIEITDWGKYDEDQKRRKRRREKGKNISEGIKIAAVLKGHHSNVPYAYIKSDFGYVIDRRKADYVKEMFELARQGLSNAEIAKRLDDLGIETPSGLPNWNGAAVLAILSNVAYNGRIKVGAVQRGVDRAYRKPEKRPDVYEDNHPAIIDTETFDQVQMILKERSRKRAESIEASKTDERDVNQYGKIARCKLCNAQLEFIAKTAQNHRKTSIFRCVNHTGANPKGEPLDKQPLIEFGDMNNRVVDACNDYICEAAALVHGSDLILEMLGWESENLVSWCGSLGEAQLKLRDKLMSEEISEPEYLEQAMELCSEYPDIIEGMNSIDDEWIEAEMMPTTLSVVLGSEPLELYQEELDIEKVKSILDRIWLNPDGTIDVDFKVDIEPWKAQFLDQKTG